MNPHIKFNQETPYHPPQRVEKTWGYELWIHNSPMYCGKLLVFTKAGIGFSMHYHMEKNESWYVQDGYFHFEWIDTDNGTRHYIELTQGHSVDIPVGLPHKLTPYVDNSVIFEISEHHKDSDSYRIYRNSPMEIMPDKREMSY